MRVLFWGSPAFAVPSLRAIQAAGHVVAGVICQPDRPRGRGLKTAACAVKLVALELGLECIQPEKPRGEEFVSLLKGLAPDISVVVAYGHILRPEILDVPAYGSINLHASILPAYRGAAPIQRAISDCAAVTGLTVIRMDAGMDTGDMLAVREVAIGPDETAGELSERLSCLGGELLPAVLEMIERGAVKATPQPSTGISYAPKIEREEARIDWRLPAEAVAARARAFDPWPGAWCIRGVETLKLFGPRTAEVSNLDPGQVVAVDSGLTVCCGDRRAVTFSEVQAEGKKRMHAADWLRGARLAPGEKVD